MRELLSTAGRWLAKCLLALLTLLSLVLAGVCAVAGFGDLVGHELVGLDKWVSVLVEALFVAAFLIGPALAWAAGLQRRYGLAIVAVSIPFIAFALWFGLAG